MFKILLGIAVLFFSTFCGYFFSKKYRNRKDFFVKMSAFNDCFLNEIFYYKRPLSEVVKESSLKGGFGLFASYFLKNLSRPNLLLDSKVALENMGCFSKDEQEFILRYFSSLGKGDSRAQTQYFLSIKTSLNEYMDRAKADYSRYGKLYLKLGFLSGLAILVLII